MEERKAKVICYERSARRDLISKLPDSLISQILLHIPTKEAVKTSVLSKSWKSVWLLIPELDLDSSEFPDYNAFVGFIDKFLDFHREHKSICLDKLKLSISKDKIDQSCVTRWLDFVATRKLKHLDVTNICCGYPSWLDVRPVSLYICETLLYLRLYMVRLGSFKSVSLPCLKTMCLEQNVYAKATDLESLISSCPVLEDLRIVRLIGNDNVLVLRVYSKTITSLRVGCDGWFWGADRDNLELLIDAPRLKYLSFEHEHSLTKVLSNLSSVKVNIVGKISEFYLSGSVDLLKQQKLHNFFTAISKVRDLILSDIEIINSYLRVEEPLPQFCNLSSLEAKVSCGKVEIFVPTVLESFPNLKSIVLDLTESMIESEQITVSSVPQCLLSSLEFVEIKSSRARSDTVHVAMELARFFAENSVILKKLVLSWKGSILKEDSVLRDLLAVLRRPSTCQIEVCGPKKRLVSGS